MASKLFGGLGGLGGSAAKKVTLAQKIAKKFLEIHKIPNYEERMKK